jgi:uncharacterized protein
VGDPTFPSFLKRSIPNGKPHQKWDSLGDLKDCLFLFDVENKKFMFNENTCNFCEIDAPVGRVVSCILAGTSFRDMEAEFVRLFPQESLKEVLDELHTLQLKRFITADDRLSRIGERRRRFVSALCLIMATDCNLRCKYCYAGGGNYKHPRKLMNTVVAEKSIDFFVGNSGRLAPLEVSFFGGEPLLNFEVIKDTVHYAEKVGPQHGKKFSFTVTTNGTLLTPEMMDFFVEHDFSYIISIDGPKELNDLFRVFPSGCGTYDMVISKLREFTGRHPNVYRKITLRGTFTSQTKDITKSLYHLKQLGFKDISLETAATEDESFQINENNMSSILEEYDKTAKAYLETIKSGDDLRFFHMHQLFFQVAEGTQRITQCGAGFGYLAVDPDGTIYPCHRLVGDSRFTMGSVFQNTLDPKIVEMFERSTVNHKQDCRKCWARYICGGGCHATALQFNKDILQPYKIECELMKHRIKLGAWIYSQLE